MTSNQEIYEKHESKAFWAVDNLGEHDRETA